MPIFKKECEVTVSNYRPVCLTLVFIKLLEPLVKDDLLLHHFQHNLLSDKQYGTSYAVLSF